MVKVLRRSRHGGDFHPTTPSCMRHCPQSYSQRCLQLYTFLSIITHVGKSCRQAPRRRVSPTHLSASIGSGLRREYGSRRAHVQVHSWNRAVIPESTGSCRRSTWSTFPPLCSDQSSAGAAREAVYRRRPGLPSRRTHHLEQPAGQCDIYPVSVNLPSAFKKHFCSRPRSLTLSLIPGKLFPTSS